MHPDAQRQYDRLRILPSQGEYEAYKAKQSSKRRKINALRDERYQQKEAKVCDAQPSLKSRFILALLWSVVITLTWLGGLWWMRNMADGAYRQYFECAVGRSGCPY